jgi:hypothetical protein
VLKTYLRRYSDGRMQSVTRGLRPPEAIVEFRRLLARDDLAGEEWAAILRDDIGRRTLLFSRFDIDEQRLMPDDTLDWEWIFMSEDGPDDTVRAIVARRRTVRW